MSQIESDRSGKKSKEINEAVHVCHVHEKCCTVKKGMKFVTLPPCYAGNFTGFPSTSVRFPRNVGISVISKEVVVVFCVPSSMVLVVVPIVARRLRSVLEDVAVVRAMSRSWLMAVLAGVAGTVGVPVTGISTFEAESEASKFGRRKTSGLSLLRSCWFGNRSRGGRGRMGSRRRRRNGAVGGGETDVFLVDAGRFLVLRDDCAGVFSDGFHGLSETSGFLDGEDVNKDWVARGSTWRRGESLSKSGRLVIR